MASDYPQGMARDLRLYQQEIKRARYENQIEAFRQAGVEIEEKGNRVLLVAIDGKRFYFATSTGRWRAEGKETWYHSGGAKRFVEFIRNGGKR